MEDRYKFIEVVMIVVIYRRDHLGKSMAECVKINVGGMDFTTTREMIKKVMGGELPGKCWFHQLYQSTYKYVFRKKVPLFR